MVDWLAGKRVKGTSSERTALNGGSATADYTSDFSTRDGFSADYSSYLVVNTTNERIDFSVNANSLNGLITKDLGAGFGSTKFLARWHFHVTNANLNSTSGQAANIRMGLADSTSQTLEVPTNDQMYQTLNAGYTDFYNALRVADGSTNTEDASSNDPVSASSDNTDWYFELKRDGNDFTAQYYSDSTYQTTIGTLRSITKSNVGSLRYLYFRIFTQTVSGTPLLDGYIDTINVYDGVTSALNPPNLQNGTIFEETDTNKAYIWSSSSQTWTQL